MTDIELALLRSLANKPIQVVSPSLQSVVVTLQDGGYIARGASGWMATERGCVALEQMRAKARA